MIVYKARCDYCNATMKFDYAARRDAWVEHHCQFLDKYSLSWHNVREWDEGGE